MKKKYVKQKHAEKKTFLTIKLYQWKNLTSNIARAVSQMTHFTLSLLAEI